MESPPQSMLLTSNIETPKVSNTVSEPLKLITELEADVEQLFQACTQILTQLNQTLLSSPVEDSSIYSFSWHQLNKHLTSIDLKCDQLVLLHYQSNQSHK